MKLYRPVERIQALLGLLFFYAPGLKSLYLGQSSTASPDLGMGRGEFLGHCEILYHCWGPGASVFHKHILL